MSELSRATPGFVGRDLSALVNEAGYLAFERMLELKEATDPEVKEDWCTKAWTPEELEKLSITMSDFEEAAKLVQPSFKREGFSGIPNVKWEDVGGYSFLREMFDRYIVRPIKDYKESFVTRFLLYGPTGCGKTLIAKAIANEAGANFIHIRGPESLEKYVCKNGSAGHTICSLARLCSPCIIFFDEVDGLVTGPLLRQLLNELEDDDDDQLKGVYIIGATNRPDLMDPALLRPGRFGNHVYVPLPTEDERALILKALSKKKPLDGDVDLDAIARREACAGFSGADLKALINEAAMDALAAAADAKEVAAAAAAEGTSESSSLSPSDQGSMQFTIKAIHFEEAFRRISPSVSDEQIQQYESFRRS